MVCIDLLASCVRVDDFDVSGHFFKPSLLSGREAGRIFFILYFSERAAHAGSKEYPLDMVCINVLAACRKLDDF